MSMIELHNIDCMEYMKGMEDNAFDLAIVDPPYGIGEDGGRFRDRKGGGHRVLPKKDWDSCTPSPEYFTELKRVSENQIIWGANHFASSFDSSSSGWIYWDKLMGGDFSDGELAYTSFQKALKSFTYCNKRGGAIHPTQKPVKLYEWLLANYAKEGDKILDTHLGSGSSAIAAHYGGFDFVGCELDEDYFKAASARIETETAQIDMF
jgi:site-specific DNA-methyltransferase (adenine-specific)